MSTRPDIVDALVAMGYKAAGAGMRKGVVLVIGTNTKAIIASAVGQGKYRGIQLDEGQLPDGAANYGVDASHPAEMVSAAKKGLIRGLAAGSTTVTAGDQLWSNASGLLITRVPYSFSGFILGQADETATVGTAPQFVDIEMLPQYQEIVRQVTVSQPLKTTTIGAATVYGATTGTAFGTAAIQLYRARFAGETIRNLSASLGIAPGGSDTVAVTVQKSSDNGNTWADTALTCTVSAALFSATDLTHSAVLAAGDILAIKLVSSAGTAAGACVSFDIT
jgi:hypothetical protein